MATVSSTKVEKSTQTEILERSNTICTECNSITKMLCDSCLTESHLYAAGIRSQWNMLYTYTYIYILYIQIHMHVHIYICIIHRHMLYHLFFQNMWAKTCGRLFVPKLDGALWHWTTAFNHLRGVCLRNMSMFCWTQSAAGAATNTVFQHVSGQEICKAALQGGLHVLVSGTQIIWTCWTWNLLLKNRY